MVPALLDGVRVWRRAVSAREGVLLSSGVGEVGGWRARSAEGERLPGRREERAEAWATLEDGVGGCAEGREGRVVGLRAGGGGADGAVGAREAWATLEDGAVGAREAWATLEDGAVPGGARAVPAEAKGVWRMGAMVERREDGMTRGVERRERWSWEREGVCGVMVAGTGKQHPPLVSGRKRRWLVSTAPGEMGLWVVRHSKRGKLYAACG